MLLNASLGRVVCYENFPEDASSGGQLPNRHTNSNLKYIMPRTEKPLAPDQV